MKPAYMQQELEADYMGFVLGAHAGFKPEAMPRLLEKLRSDSPSLLGTHPSDDERLRRAHAMLGAARMTETLRYRCTKPLASKGSNRSLWHRFRPFRDWGRCT